MRSINVRVIEMPDDRNVQARACLVFWSKAVLGSVALYNEPLLVLFSFSHIVTSC
jgi:hypothetical protein